MRKRNWKLQSQIDQIKPFLNSSKSILIAAGAGIGVDSDLPDFRGQDGFWKAYPPLAKLGLKFEEMANPRWFYDDPHLAWGFYGHRFGSYKSTIPHAGFSILKKWVLSKESFFVFTSNVDGQFQSAGFQEENIFECHGSIHFLQCLANCGQKKIGLFRLISISMLTKILFWKRASSYLSRLRKFCQTKYPHVFRSLLGIVQGR